MVRLSACEWVVGITFAEHCEDSRHGRVKQRRLNAIARVNYAAPLSRQDIVDDPPLLVLNIAPKRHAISMGLCGLLGRMNIA